MPSPSAAVAATVDEYLAYVPEPARTTLGKIRAAIRAAAPREATEAISYRIPTFQYQGTGLIGYAAFPKHCSLFPMSLAVMAAFEKDLAAYDTSKGTIHFPVNKPLPAVLVKKLVKARIAEKDQNSKGKR